MTEFVVCSLFVLALLAFVAVAAIAAWIRKERGPRLPCITSPREYD